MFSPISICLLGFILVLGFELCNSLKCHVCNSHLQEECEDPFDSTEFIQECNETDTLCRKIYQDSNGEIRTIRSCGYKKHHKYDCYMTGAEHYRTFVCHCYDDLCNASPKTTATWAALVIVLFMWLFVTFV